MTNEKALRDLGTHFSGSEGKWTSYHIETCPKCGRDVQAANAIGVAASRERLESLGMIYREKIPPELVCNEDGDAVCFYCAYND